MLKRLLMVKILQITLVLIFYLLNLQQQSPPRFP